MIHACCPTCRLRFSPPATILDACPECGQSLEAVSSPRDVVGFRLIMLDAPPQISASAAAAISIPIPGPGEGRSGRGQGE